MKIDTNSEKHEAITPAPRYTCPVKPMSTPLVMVLITGTVLLLVIIALQMGRGIFPTN